MEADRQLWLSRQQTCGKQQTADLRQAADSDMQIRTDTQTDSRHCGRIGDDLTEQKADRGQKTENRKGWKYTGNDCQNSGTIRVSS